MGLPGLALFAHDRIQGVTKRYGDFTAVDEVSFTAGKGRVTGFLGPNGAGKSTSMRIMVGLTRPDSGRCTIDGQLYADLPNPARKVGAVGRLRPAQWPHWP
jgi:ABC-2 type transport system ATP-binding protein